MSDEPVPAPTPFAPAPAGAVVLYRGATVIDGTGAPGRPGTTVVVDGERIVEVAADAEVDPADYAGAELVDLAGAFLIPGLIDSHQHLATPPNRPVAEAVLRRDLFGGVTTARDMADDLRQVGDLARAARVGEIAAPDLYYAALMAGPTFFDDPRTWQVSQGAVPGRNPWMQAVDEGTDLPLAVAMARGTSATAVKIYADLPADRVAAIAAEAHRQGLLVWAHATVFPARPGEVVAAGADSVSHVTLLVHEATEGPLVRYRTKPPLDEARFAGGDDPAIEALFGAMRERGTILDATASMWGRIAAAGGDAEDARQRALAQDTVSAALTAQAHRAGVEISTGTDSDPDLTLDWPPLHDELVYLHERCGMTPLQVLRSATLIGARSLGGADERGTVEEGKLADLVVLDADPAADLAAALRSVRTVVKRGCRHNRSDFERSGATSGRAGTADTATAIAGTVEAPKTEDPKTEDPK
ncbi:Imidazolonepropionase [Actinacidiphila yanglinensis]|uniref:Imidazolonepropionase n=1 Tax=Actinacidiphila yanglinensis TaxID=310779 RepID=A0A1H5YRM4_9ACTN|nr:amidohydrolase family protein [Actinacidiphila yanglinensis]SEG26322.1 Imidazolonepropionase [Actinacidiphila yanglinensis]